MKEIKVNENVLNKELNQFKQVVNDLNPSFDVQKDGENQLELTDKINQLNQSFNQTIETLQVLLKQNISMTEEAIASLKTTDHDLQTQIQLTKQE
ncbi:DUF5344 family protein [Amphibacillus cookii]|uniref:DUF5344 family protein n=1 Tax=Amphibacillus cookii TaxID=767787 RepID=UPI00195706A0|nr:DUF5344 family protein [Amphibacillus cookii]MBM7543013.1 methyl-accepting chemotaxis protein [Amphibacillus cookii]